MCQAPLVQLRAVSKSYDNGTAALVGFDMSLAEGEFVSLLGPSGCGKSTALRMIAGLDKPTSGGIRRSWDGGPSVKAASTQAVSCVFQEPTLMPWTDVW